MANNCVYSLLVVGEKENVNEFISMMNYTHPQHLCFARIFDAYEAKRTTLKDGRTAVKVDGDCAWSVYSCMMEGAGTYYDTSSQDDDYILTTLTKESQRLRLDIEVFSEESGMGFTEHYRIINGQVIVYTCTEYQEYYYDSSEYPDFKDFLIDNNLPLTLTMDDLDEDNYYYTGKLDWSFALV